MPGVQVRVTDQCAGCGICTEDVCFVDAIHLEGTEAVIDPTCRGCGRCVTVCPQGAIELTFEHNRFVEASIARISPLVDVS
jgi:heterodisulfide reductase subunit A-like polyferredoxin